MLKKLLISSLLLVSTVFAQAQEVLIPAPPSLSATGYLLKDARSGKILVEHNADQQLPPASLTKMMTSYIVSAEIDAGRLSEDAMVDISVKAWRKGGSKMFVREGSQVSVKDLLRGVIIQSGNDASIALAEHIAGSESSFVDIMNQKAALLGMTNTHFENSTGWPAEGHLTTARDLAILAEAVINDYPEHYKLYREKYFSYNGINQPNRNRLLFRDESVDGLKTGHTEEAGYCLVASAERNDMRLIAVVMGTDSEDARATETQKLLSYGFRYYQTQKLYSAGDEISTSRVWAGQSDSVGLGVAHDITLTIPRGSQDALEAKLHINETIKAPVAEGQELGNLTIELRGEMLVDTPLVATNSVEEAGFFARLWANIKLFFLGIFG